jgi:FMN phosphatase YigB (HAD superfamily)
MPMVRLTQEEVSRVPGQGRQVQAVTYDLWLTLLVDVDPAVTHTLRARTLAELLEVSYDDALTFEREAHKAMRRAWFAHRALTLPDLATVVLRAAGRDLDQLEDVVHAIESPTSLSGVRLLPGAREVLETFTTAGMPLGLICDTGMTSGTFLRRLLDDLGILAAFEVTVFSDETGVPKPGGVPFAVALEALDTKPADAVHVGDIRRRDVTGALAAGMAAIRYRGGRDDIDQLTPDAPVVVDRHDEVPALVL